jgi:HlyD family secretion protein
VRRLLAAFVIIALLLAGTLVIAGPRMRELAASLQGGDSAVEVRIHPITLDGVTEAVSAPGLVEPRRKVDISAEISARVIELPFREGDAVRKGEIVVRLDDRDLKAALESVRARRDAERYRLQSEQERLAGPVASLELQRKTLERQAKLLESGDTSQQVVDEAVQRVRDLEASIAGIRRTIAVLESSVEAAQADISRAEEAVRRTVISSPIDGLITKLNAEVGELVLVGTMNNPGTVIMTVADLSAMLLKAEVAETDVARLKPGQRSRIHLNAYPDQSFEGVLERTDLQRTDRTGLSPYFGTEIAIELDGRTILSGLAANVDIEIERHTGLVLPSQAVLQRPLEDLPLEVRDLPAVDQSRRVISVVYRMIDGKAVCTPVRIGPSDLKSTLIREGLSEGDLVVVGPFKNLENLKHGDPLRREGQAPDAATGGAPTRDSEEPSSGGVNVRL